MADVNRGRKDREETGIWGLWVLSANFFCKPKNSLKKKFIYLKGKFQMVFFHFC